MASASDSKVETYFVHNLSKQLLKGQHLQDNKWSLCYLPYPASDFMTTVREPRLSKDRILKELLTNKIFEKISPYPYFQAYIALYTKIPDNVVKNDWSFETLPPEMYNKLTKLNIEDLTEILNIDDLKIESDKYKLQPIPIESDKYKLQPITIESDKLQPINKDTYKASIDEKIELYLNYDKLSNIKFVTEKPNYYNSPE